MDRGMFKRNFAKIRGRFQPKVHPLLLATKNDHELSHLLKKSRMYEVHYFQTIPKKPYIEEDDNIIEVRREILEENVKDNPETVSLSITDSGRDNKHHGKKSETSSSTKSTDSIHQKHKNHILQNEELNEFKTVNSLKNR